MPQVLPDLTALRELCKSCPIDLQVAATDILRGISPRYGLAADFGQSLLLSGTRKTGLATGAAYHNSRLLCYHRRQVLNYQEVGTKPPWLRGRVKAMACEVSLFIFDPSSVLLEVGEA